MSWKKTSRFWKIGLLAISFMLLLYIPGCSGDTLETEARSKENREDIPEEKAQSKENREDMPVTEVWSIEARIMEACCDIYEKAAEENKTDDLETLRRIVNKVGEIGYAAIDSRNQIDMECGEQVINFWEKTEAKEESRLTIVEVTYWGGFAVYDLQTAEGKVDVVKSSYKYENGSFQKIGEGSYTAENWVYTQDGYLMFSGAWFSKERYVLTLSGVEEHTAFRVEPLDEACRELNRKYLSPISYERNNMFITDWSEDDFGELNFYDLFDMFYPKIKGRFIPYITDDNLNVGTVYHIPKDEFESVIMTYINIDSQSLQSKTVYDSEKAVYEYKPRGFYEGEYPEYPYPEVVDFEGNKDGTITLTVHAVFPYAGISKVYAHEVVIRPLAEGGVQYISNRVLSSEDNYEETWHTPRLTGEEWSLLYPNVSIR